MTKPDRRNRFAAVMPTYNQREFIEEAVDSTISQLDLLVVCDDGSDDGTQEYLLALEKSRGAFYWMQHGENQGTAIAINSAMGMLEQYYPEVDESQDWVTWISSDNTYDHNWVQIFRDHIGDREDLGVVYTGCSWGGRRPLFSPYHPGRQIRTEACYLGPSFFVRRDVWRECGGHRGKISHDLDHFLRLEETCWRIGLNIEGLEVFPCHYRVHPKRVTKTRRHQYDAPDWIEEALKRRAATEDSVD